MSHLYKNATSNIDDKVDIISNQLLLIVNIINLEALAGTVAVLGIVGNMINIVIFVKQGFNDTVNIGLMALAVSDLCALFAQEWISILNNPFFISNVPMILVEVQHLSGCWPHVCFARISSWITAFITIERCLCVVVPLKIKTIITPRVSVCVVVFIFLFMFLSLIPDYATCYIDWKLMPESNITLLGIIFLPGREQLDNISFNISAGTQISSFGAVIICTFILVVKMEQKSRWRRSASSTGSSDAAKEKANRDRRTVKMITIVAFIYCFCFLPMLCVFITTCIQPEFITFGSLNNSLFFVWSFAFLLDSVNASVNIFVYYRMSSKYRGTFNALFRKTLVVVGK